MFHLIKKSFVCLEATSTRQWVCSSQGSAELSTRQWASCKLNWVVRAKEARSFPQGTKYKAQSNGLTRKTRQGRLRLLFDPRKRRSFHKATRQQDTKQWAIQWISRANLIESYLLFRGSFGQPCKRFRFKFFIIKKSYEWG